MALKATNVTTPEMLLYKQVQVQASISVFPSCCLRHCAVAATSVCDLDPNLMTSEPAIQCLNSISMVMHAHGASLPPCYAQVKLAACYASPEVQNRL